MNDEFPNGGHGLITVEYTVFCCQCSEWEYLNSKSKLHAAKVARAQGWKFDRKTRRWSCPAHNQNGASK